MPANRKKERSGPGMVISAEGAEAGAFPLPSEIARGAGAGSKMLTGGRGPGFPLPPGKPKHVPRDAVRRKADRQRGGLIATVLSPRACKQYIVRTTGATPQG